MNHYRACKREKKKLENDGKSYLVPQMCPQCGKTLCSKQSLDNHLKVQVWQVSGCCTTDSQTNVGTNQLHNNVEN